MNIWRYDIVLLTVLTKIVGLGEISARDYDPLGMAGQETKRIATLW